MKLKLKKKRVLKRLLPPAKSTPSVKTAASAGRSLRSAYPSTAKTQTLDEKERERFQYETGRMLAAIDEVRTWGTFRGLNAGSDILRAAYLMLDYVERRTPDPVKKGKK